MRVFTRPFNAGLAENTPDIINSILTFGNIFITGWEQRVQVRSIQGPETQLPQRAVYFL